MRLYKASLPLVLAVLVVRGSTLFLHETIERKAIKTRNKIFFIAI
jgi:hypothetical protein